MNCWWFQNVGNDRWAWRWVFHRLLRIMFSLVSLKCFWNVSQRASNMLYAQCGVHDLGIHLPENVS